MNRIGIGLEARLTVSQVQKLVITPQLQQAIKLLQLNHFELAEMLQEELLENPVLEELAGLETPGEEPKEPDSSGAEDASGEGEAGAKVEGAEAGGLEEPSDLELPVDLDGKALDENALDEVDWNAYFEDVDFSKSALPSNKEVYDSDLPSLEARLTEEESLSDHLYWQLNLLRMSDDELQMASLIVGYLNDDGWLVLEGQESEGPEAVMDVLARHMTEQEENMRVGEGLAPWDDAARESRYTHWREIVDDALEIVQELEPPGVGARSLEEALLIQCRTREGMKDPALIQRLIVDHLRDLERKNYNAIAKKIKISLEELIEAAEVIRQFEPRPGRNFLSEPAAYITPDIHVRKVGGEYEVSLNDDGLPKLKISGFYKQAIKEKKNATGKEFIQEKLRNATWLLKSIHQRQRTIYRVTESIVKRQRDFLDKGLQYLKPMILRDVANDIGMHESTISRVTTNKYVHTPQGVFELKFFFTSSLQSSRGGEDVSSLTVKEKIKRLVEGEDPRSPLSDQQIVETLGKGGIQIARRTVAKYRGQLGIASSNKRKKPY